MGSMSTVTLLAGLQDSAGLSQLGSAELKAIGILEQLLSGGEFEAMLPIAIAAFLLGKDDLQAAVSAGIVTADATWIEAARKRRNMDFHWRPNQHPQISSAVIRPLGLAELVRGLWLALNAGDENWREKVNLI